MPGVRAGAMKVVVVRTHPAFLDEAGVEPDTPPYPAAAVLTGAHYAGHYTSSREIIQRDLSLIPFNLPSSFRDRAVPELAC